MQDNKKKKAPDSGRTITIILSVVIALILWSYVIIQVNPTKEETIPRIPVQLLNEQSLTARQLAVSGDGEYFVDVVVEGRRADIAKVKGDDIVAEMELYGWTKGENYISVDVKVPSGLKIVEIRPAKIQVTIEELVALSKPVVVSYRGAFGNEAEEGDVELRPAEIEVTGAKSAVESVYEVKIYVDKEDLTSEGVELQCEAVPLNYAEVIVENVRLSSNYVNLSAKLLHLKEVPLILETLGSSAQGFGIEIDAPNTIFVKGERAELKNIEAIKTEPLDVSKISKNGNVTLVPILPEGVALSKRNVKIVAAVRIEEISEKQFVFPAGDIIMEGLTKGKSVNTDISSVTVSVSGRKQIVDQLQQNQLQPYIEVGDLPAGAHAVPVKVSVTQALHSISVAPEQITIVITNTEEGKTSE